MHANVPGLPEKGPKDNPRVAGTLEATRSVDWRLATCE